MPRKIATLALVFLAFGGYVKALPSLGQVGGVDTTLIAAGGVALGVVVLILGPWRKPAGSLVLVGALVLAFSPGAVGFDLSGYAGQKVVVELPLVFLSLLGGLLILDSETARRWWLGAVVAFGALVAGLAVLFPDEIAAGVGSLALTGGSTISQGRATGAAVVVLVSLALTGRRRLLPLAAAALLAWSMLLSGSRGPTYGAVVAVLAVAALVPGGRRAARGVLAAAAVFMAGRLAFSVDLVSNRLTTIRDTSAQERKYLWEQASQLIVHHPAGIGWGQLVHYLPPGIMLQGVGDRQYPHDVLLEVGSEGGWLAVLGLAVALVVGFRRQARAAATPVEAAMLGLLVFLFVNALVSGDIGDNRGLWVALGAALVASRPASEVGDDRDEPVAAGTSGTGRGAVDRGAASTTSGTLAAGTSRAARS